MALDGEIKEFALVKFIMETHGILLIFRLSKVQRQLALLHKLFGKMIVTKLKLMQLGLTAKP